MLKIIGAILLICGTTGFGLACRDEMNQILYHLRYLQNILELIKSEISYSKATLPEACKNVGKKVHEPYQSSLTTVCEVMKKNKGLTFDVVWKQEMGKCLKKLPLKKKEIDIFLDFSTCSGFPDNKMQVKALEQYYHLLGQSVKTMEESIENKSKVVMSMGLISGIFLTIVLL